MPGTRGWRWDEANTRLQVFVEGTEVARFDSADIGLAILANGITVTAGGLTVTAGGLTVTAGGLTVTAGGLTVTAGGLTVTAGNLAVSAGSILSASATAGVGYATGAGGAVTQLTNKATGVTLSTVTGIITMNAASLAADVTVAFTLTNTAIAATDAVVVLHESAGTIGAYSFGSTAAAGTAAISVHNTTPAALAEAIVLRFVVIKSVNA